MHFPQIHGKGWGITSPSKAPPLGELAGASPTERARLLTENHRRCDSIALTKSLPIAAQRLFPAGLALSVTFGDTSPKGRGFGRAENFSSSPEAPLLGELSAKQTERLYEGKPFLCRKVRLLASPVSFWRNVWYNGFAALPAHFIREGGESNELYSIFCSVCRSKCNVVLHLQVA